MAAKEGAVAHAAACVGGGTRAPQRGAATDGGNATRAQRGDHVPSVVMNSRLARPPSMAATLDADKATTPLFTTKKPEYVGDDDALGTGTGLNSDENVNRSWPTEFCRRVDLAVTRNCTTGAQRCTTGARTGKEHSNEHTSTLGHAYTGKHSQSGPG